MKALIVHASALDAEPWQSSYEATFSTLDSLHAFLRAHRDCHITTGPNDSHVHILILDDIPD